VVSSGYPCGIFWLPLWYLLNTSEDTTGVTRRYHRGNQNILQRQPENTTGVIRRYHRGNQKIPQGNQKIPKGEAEDTTGENKR
jgi:hypothetical protein